jgi:hypothetical protein
MRNFALIIFLTLAIGAIYLSSTYSPSDRRPRISQEIVTPGPPEELNGDFSEPMSEVPVPQPTLVLKLEKPEKVISTPHGEAKKPAIVPSPLAVVTPITVKTSQVEDPLSHFEISVDDKRRPIINYKFSEKSLAAKEADLRNPQPAIEP